jgi:hypothetical protein
MRRGLLSVAAVLLAVAPLGAVRATGNPSCSHAMTALLRLFPEPADEPIRARADGARDAGARRGEHVRMFGMYGHDEYTRGYELELGTPRENPEACARFLAP